MNEEQLGLLYQIGFEYVPDTQDNVKNVDNVNNVINTDDSVEMVNEILPQHHKPMMTKLSF